MAMNSPDATFTNGRYELPAHARGVLVLADPPEAGWRIEPSKSGIESHGCQPKTQDVWDGASSRGSS